MDRVINIDNFAKTFEDLDVYKKAYELSLEIHKKAMEFPKCEEYVLSSQIRRASKSICANIAEGFVKQGQSSAEFGRFLSMALGSSGEMLVWIKYCLDLGYIDRLLYEKWREEYFITSRMLQSLRNKIKKQSND